MHCARLDADGPELSYYEVATAPMLFTQLDSRIGGRRDPRRRGLPGRRSGHRQADEGRSIRRHPRWCCSAAPTTAGWRLVTHRGDGRAPVDPLALSAAFAQMLHTAGITARS